MSCKLSFGRYIGKALDDPEIPDDYIRRLASRGKYMSKTNRFETAWKVPVPLWMAAREEMENRGYRHIGERFEKIGED
jgi:hypothetical protein